MTPYYAEGGVTIHHGDSLDVLRDLPDASVHSVVTDPPYGIAFMGKQWDQPGQFGSQRKAPGPNLRRGNADAALEAGRYDLSPSAMLNFQQWCEEWARECLRVLKPGGHMLAFGGSRTWHRLACAIEDAGFEIRDSIAWMYGSGFPKSLDVSKAIDKLDASDLRDERAQRFTSWMRTTGITAAQINAATSSFMGSHYLTDKSQASIATADMFDQIRPFLPIVPSSIEALVAERTIESENYKARTVVGERVTGRGTGNGSVSVITDSGNYDLTLPHTPDAERWQGWGTALKPAFEPIVVGRKPLIGTVAANVLEHGTGALNIDGCRVGDSGGGTQCSRRDAAGDCLGHPDAMGSVGGGLMRHGPNGSGGRWPANVILDESQARALDEMSGESTTPRTVTRGASLAGKDGATARSGGAMERRDDVPCHGDSGGASRFFFIAREDNEPCSDDSGPESLSDTDTNGTMPPAASAAPGGASSTAAPAGSPTFTDYSYPQTWVAGLPVDDLASRFTYVAKADSAERVRVDGIAHPTVKPLDLMRWLVRLVTPPGGVVLEPFAGSGTTVEACLLEGFDCIAIEREADYLPLIRQRLDRRRDPVAAVRSAGEDAGLFDLLEGA